MLILQIQTDIVWLVISTLVSGGIIIAAVTAVWNLSKKINTLENDNKTGKEQHNKDIEALDEKIQEIKEQRSTLVLEYSNKIQGIEKDLINLISEAKVERKEEITKALGNSKDEFALIQKQFDNLNLSIKDVSTRVTEVNTKVLYIEREIKDLKQCDKDNSAFHTDWTQRVEDRIKETDKYIRELVTRFFGGGGVNTNKILP